MGICLHCLIALTHKRRSFRRSNLSSITARTWEGYCTPSLEEGCIITLFSRMASLSNWICDEKVFISEVEKAFFERQVSSMIVPLVTVNSELSSLKRRYTH